MRLSHAFAPPQAAQNNLRRGAECLDSRNFIRVQSEVKHGDVVPHVDSVGGAGERDHADLQGKPGYDRGGGPALASGNADEFRVGEGDSVRRDERETLGR